MIGFLRSWENSLEKSIEAACLLISGSQVRALVRQPSSPPKLAVEDLPAERPIFGRLFGIVRAALASLRIGLVS